jgi:DNA-binding transcriptional LysR family regulator
VPVGHHLSGREVITPRDLNGVACILGADRTPLRQRLGQVFRDAGVQPDIRVEVTTAHTAAALVAEGVGICVIARLSYDNSFRDRIRIVRFQPKLAGELAFFYPASRSPEGIAIEFIEAYENAAHGWQAIED